MNKPGADEYENEQALQEANERNLELEDEVARLRCVLQDAWNQADNLASYLEKA